jgi:hypothetical protein
LVVKLVDRWRFGGKLDHIFPLHSASVPLAAP